MSPINQSLLSFEQVTVDAEESARAARTAAEQHERESKAAAKVLLQAARDKIKAEKQAKTEDWRRKTSQARTYRTPHEHAQCGIRWYCRSPKDIANGSYWHNCHACGQPLIYTSDPNTKPQLCKAATA